MTPTFHFTLPFIHYPSILSTNQLLEYLSDRAPGDEDKPDLRVYAALDAAALKDVRQVGSDYMKAYAAVLHNTSGLKPGYLPEAEALSTLSGALHLLTLASYLEERAAKLKREALGRAMVAFAGSPPNCFYQLLEAFFGYKKAPASGVASTVADTSFPSTLPEEPASTAASSSLQVPAHLKPAMSASAFTSGSESESRASSKLSLESTQATGFKPSLNSDLWTDTGLAKEYVPKIDSGGSDYACPFPSCNRKSVAQKDTMSTHVRRDHLNIAISCHHCNRLFWSREGWSKHCACKHLGLPPVPSTTEAPVLPSVTEQLSALRAIKQEESQIFSQAAPKPQLHSAELEHEEIMIIDDSSQEGGATA